MKPCIKGIPLVVVAPQITAAYTNNVCWPQNSPSVGQKTIHQPEPYAEGRKRTENHQPPCSSFATPTFCLVFCCTLVITGVSVPLPRTSTFGNRLPALIALVTHTFRLRIIRLVEIKSKWIFSAASLGFISGNMSNKINSAIRLLNSI